MVTYDIQHIHRTTPYTKEAKSAPAVASTAQSSADDFNMELEMAGVDELIGVLMAYIYMLNSHWLCNDYIDVRVKHNIKS